MIKKIILGAFMFFSVLSHSFPLSKYLTTEEIREQYEFFLDQIVYRYDMVVNDDYFYVCQNWRMAVLFAEELNADTKVTDINLIVLVDILNNHDYSSEVKAGLQNKLSYFQNSCQPHVNPLLP